MGGEMGGAGICSPLEDTAPLLLVCFQDFGSWGQSCRKVSTVFESCCKYAVFGGEKVGVFINSRSE